MATEIREAKAENSETRSFLLGLLGLLVLSSGCTTTATRTIHYGNQAEGESELVSDRFASVSSGMTRERVYALLGTPQREGLHFGVWEQRQKGVGRSILEIEFDDAGSVRKTTRTDLRVAPVSLDPES